MRKFGLIGRNLTHSFSPEYFKQKFLRENISGAGYDLFDIPNIAEVSELIQTHSDLAGFNVTIPYKESIIPFLDELEPSAREIGAVNTVKLIDGQMLGYNTDAFGFTRSLAAVFKTHHERALILGTGGASKAVSYALKKLGVEHVFVSRQKRAGGLQYHELTDLILKHYPLIVNTTPLGTFPDVNSCPDIPYDALTERNLLYDLVYNPEESLFLKKGSAAGAATLNGYRMLVLQAEKSWEIWNS